VSTPPQDLEKLISEVNVPKETQKVLKQFITAKRAGNLSSKSPKDAILGTQSTIFTETNGLS